MTVLFVVPAGVTDPAVPSGGNVYDRQVSAVWPELRMVGVAGEWPEPSPGARAELDAVLAQVPDGADVLFDGLVACGVPEVLVPQLARLRGTVLVHLPLGDEPGAAPELVATERAVLGAARRVVATSRWAARRLAEVHGPGIGEVHVAAPGVVGAPLTTGTAAGGRLVSVGSVTRRKGHDLLVDALAGLTDLTWACAIVGPLSGEPAHAAAVRSAIDRHGLGGRVQLTGPRSGPELEGTYAAADLLVLPSRAETYGMVVTEALARAVPVLAADVGGVPEALGTAPDGALPGLLVAPGDAEALRVALRRWLTEPSLRARIRAAAAARRTQLDGWEVTARCLTAALAA